MHKSLRVLLVLTVAGFVSRPAYADITGFVGSNNAPEARLARGAALGFGLLVVGFEFEYSDTVEEITSRSPSLRTGMGNVLLQTPGAIAGFQPYFTAGAGLYQEELSGVTTTGFASNTGGGVKISLAGPLRLRLDYRVFILGEGTHEPHPQRFYAGLNVKF